MKQKPALTQSQQDALHAHYFRLIRDMAADEDHPGHGVLATAIHRLNFGETDTVTAGEFDALWSMVATLLAEIQQPRA